MRLSNTVRYIILTALAILIFGGLIFAVIKLTPIGDQPDNTAQQQQAQIEQNKKATQKSSGSSNKAPTSPSSKSSTPTPATTPAPATSSTTTLTNSGPGDVVAVFAAVALLSGLLHYRLAVRLNQ